MSFIRKARKLLRNPQAFLADSRHPLYRWAGKQLASAFPSPYGAATEQSFPQSEKPERKVSIAKKNYFDLDIWHAYRDPLWATHQVDASAPVIAICPLGVFYLDAMRVRRLHDEGAVPVFLPVWTQFASDKDMDDLEYMLGRDPAALAAVVRNLMEWALARNATALALPCDNTALTRLLSVRAHAAGLMVLCDLPGYPPAGILPTADAMLVESAGREKRPTPPAVRRARTLASVGGNDAIRVLLLPARQFGLQDEVLRARVAEQVEAALAACEPTDHLILISKRRKGGFLDDTTRARLKAKYRKTTLFYDSMTEVDALLAGAIDVRAPVGTLPPEWANDPRVTLYVLNDEARFDIHEPRVFPNLGKALAESRPVLWPGAPCDEREIVLEKIIAGPGLDLIAVPDPLTNHVVTEGRQQHLEVLLNARARCYGADIASAFAEVFVQWGAEPSESKERPENLRSLLGVPRLYLEDGFIRSLGLWTNPNEPTCSVVMDTRSVYYDATKPSLLETLLASDYALTEDEFARARRLIDAIVHHRISKYNYSPLLDLDFRSPGKRTLLIVDQKVGDMSIKYGCASDDSFRNMLDTALAIGDDVKIVIKQHPCAINGDGNEAHFTASSLGEIAQRPNVQLIGFDVNPYSLIEAVDEVWVVSSGMGFEALMAGKPVRCFGLPFYANWGLTEDALICKRRGRRRSLEEIFHIFYIMLTRYVDPETGKAAPIEHLIDYFAEHIMQQRR